jgi:putative ABC transport system permease protein
LNRPDTMWQTYRPLTQEARTYYSIGVRTTGAPEAVVGAVRQAVASIDPDLPVNELEPMRTFVNRVLGHFILAGKVLTGFSYLGLLLAGVGIYGVISFLVAQRTGEIGIRMALGAQSRDVLWMIGGKGVMLTLVGIGLGLVGAVGVASALSAAVPEVPTSNPLVILNVGAMMIVVTLAAVFLPAWRAIKVDPTVCLRNE